MRMNLVELYGGDARIAVLGKTIRQHLQHRLTGLRVGIDVDLTKLTVRTDIIHTPHVVVMGMGDEDTVDATERKRHDLLAEVWTAVNEQTRGFRLDQRRTAQSLVVRVRTRTGVTPAPDGWYATGCACT